MNDKQKWHFELYIENSEGREVIHEIFDTDGPHTFIVPVLKDALKKVDAYLD